MWARGAAIRPVPRWAVLDRSFLSEIETNLSDDSHSGRAELDDAFGRFERSQPQLAERIGTWHTGARQSREVALECKDDDTVDLLTGFIQAFEKHAWFLHATLET